MADTLAQKLDELEPSLRTPNLLGLLSSLTVSELRLLKSRLAAVDFRTDIIARLPVELQLCIAEHVSCSDVFSYINVSRTWRHIWLQDNIMNQIAETWYPGLFLRDEEGDDSGSYDRRKDTFLRILQKDFRRSRGHFRSVLFHGFRLEDDNYFKLDETLHSAGAYREILVTPPSNRGLGGVLFFYKNGKLAWNPSTRPPPDNGVIILDDFRSKTRKMYKAPGTLMQGISISLGALGDKLVVGVDSRVAHVWHIGTNEHQEVLLPSRIYTCKSEGEYVSFVTDDGGVFVWKSHGRALEVDMTKPREIFAALSRPQDIPFQSDNAESKRTTVLTRAHIDVILHPFELGVLFIVTMNAASGLHGAIAVHEYVNNEYSNTYTVDMPSHQSTSQSQHFLPIFSLVDCFPIDSHGTFNLANLTSSSGNAVPVSITITFNVVARAFSIISQSIPLKPEHAINRRDLRRGVRSHTWGKQTTFSLSNLWDIGYRLPLITLSVPSTIPDHNRPKGPFWTVAQAIMDYALDPVRGQHFSAQNLRCMTSTLDPNVVKPRGDEGVLASRGNTNAYSLREVPMEDFPQPGICRGICGDDDFLIFVGEDNYTVWSFDTDISREAAKAPA